MSFKKTQFRAAHGYDTEEASNEASVAEYGPSKTIQSQTEDADINVMMERFGLTGKFPENPRIPSYESFEDVMDYRSAVDSVQRAQEAFMEYPPAIRGRFSNNPAEFMAFCHDPNNAEEMVKLGFRKPPKVEVTNVTPNPVPNPAPASTGGPTG